MTDNHETSINPVHPPDLGGHAYQEQGGALVPITEPMPTEAAADQITSGQSEVHDHDKIAVNEFANEATEEEVLVRAGRLTRMFQKLRSPLSTLAVGIELSPLNEGFRWGVLGLAGASIEGKSWLVGAIYAAATFAVEGLASLGVADALSRNGAKRTRAFLAKGLNRVGLEEGAPVNMAIKSAAAFLGGSGISIYLKDRETLDKRTFKEHLEYGLKTTGALAGVCAVQGFLVDQGIDSPSLSTIGGALLGFGSIPLASRWAKGQIQRANEAKQQ